MITLGLTSVASWFPYVSRLTLGLRIGVFYCTSAMAFWAAVTQTEFAGGLIIISLVLFCA